MRLLCAILICASVASADDRVDRAKALAAAMLADHRSGSGVEPPAPAPPEVPPRRVKVEFRDGFAYWDAGYGEKYWNESAFYDGALFPFHTGGAPALEYRDGWFYFLDDQRAEVKPKVPEANSDSLVVEYFGADWCPGCKKQKPVIQRLERSGVDVSWNDGDYNGSIPHTRIRVNGKVTKRWTGYVSEATIRRHIPKESAEADDGTPADSISVALDRLPEPQIAFADLGCGDGRVLIAAWKKWGKPVIGYEIDPNRAEEARRNLETAGVEDFEIIVADVTTLDSLPCDVAFAYQFPSVLESFRPLLLETRAFATYAHSVPDVNMTRVVEPNVWYWRKPEESGSRSGIAAYYGGQWYTPQNFSPCWNCGMCDYIVEEWRRQGWRG